MNKKVLTVIRVTEDLRTEDLRTEQQTSNASLRSRSMSRAEHVRGKLFAEYGLTYHSEEFIFSCSLASCERILCRVFRIRNRWYDNLRTNTSLSRIRIPARVSVVTAAECYRLVFLLGFASLRQALQILSCSGVGSPSSVSVNACSCVLRLAKLIVSFESRISCCWIEVLGFCGSSVRAWPLESWER